MARASTCAWLGSAVTAMVWVSRFNCRKPSALQAALVAMVASRDAASTLLLDNWMSNAVIVGWHAATNHPAGKGITTGSPAGVNGNETNACCELSPFVTSV